MRRAGQQDGNGGGWTALSDLMAVISFSFLLLLGVAVLSAFTQLVVARAETSFNRIATFELAQLDTAREVQRVLDQSRAALIGVLIGGEEDETAYELDDMGAGVMLNADILFEVGEYELKETHEVEDLLGDARVRLCNALELYAETFQPPSGAERLTNPFRYLEVSFEGHADRIRGRGLSNWALSSRRATSLLEAFVVPEDEATPLDPTAPCRQIESREADRIESRTVRVVASGRGAMDAGRCEDGRDDCPMDRFALLRISVRMDRVFRDLGLGNFASNTNRPTEPNADPMYSEQPSTLEIQ